MIRWFIGYDKEQAVAAHVLAHSIQSRSSIPVAITFINRENLKGIFTRLRGASESTDFSISRFLVPYLCNYKGWAIFSDNDMIVTEDVAKLWARRDDDFAVMVAKKQHDPLNHYKFLGNVQTRYEKKNWSSVMLMNTEKCKSLTLDTVNNETGLFLHQFKWLDDDSLIGDLPQGWNHLVGSDEFDPSASMLMHYTEGTPCLDKYKNYQQADLWHLEHTGMNYYKHDAHE